MPIEKQSTRTVRPVGRVSNQRTLTTMNDLTPVSTPPQDEVWLPVYGLEKIYDISSLGRVKRIVSAVNSKSGRILTASINKHGYWHIRLTQNGKAKTYLLHRLMAFTFLGLPPTPKHTEINHKNGNKSDNKIENLEWVTRSENIKHGFNNNLFSRKGESNNRAKLTWEQVKEIRQLLKKGVPYMSLAKQFNVAYGTINSIKCETSWREQVVDQWSV